MPKSPSKDSPVKPQMQRVTIRRANNISELPGISFEMSASVRISQTTSFAPMPTPGGAPGEMRIVPVFNATWETTGDDSDRRPVRGDTLIAADGTAWLVQKVTTVTHRNVRQCMAMTEITGYLPYETLNIIRPCAAVSENGVPSATDWRRVKTNLSAKVICDDLLSQYGGKSARHGEKNLRAYLQEYLHLQKNDLIELPDGRQYKPVRVRNSRQTLGWSELFLAIRDNQVVVSKNKKSELNSFCQK